MLTNPDGGSNWALWEVHCSFREDGGGCSADGPNRTEHYGIQGVESGIGRTPASPTKRMYADLIHFFPPFTSEFMFLARTFLATEPSILIKTNSVWYHRRGQKTERDQRYPRRAPDDWKCFDSAKYGNSQFRRCSWLLWYSRRKSVPKCQERERHCPIISKRC